MTGFTNASEAAILDSSTVGFGRTLYLALFKWTGTAGGGAGKEPNDDATLPTNVAEVSGGGYARKTVASTDWASAVQGAPTTKQLPKAGGAAISWTASGAAYGELCAFGFYDAPSGGNLISSGPLTNLSGTAISVTVGDGESFQFDENNPIIAKVGDLTDSF